MASSATFQIAVAPVVSDYTRYLPERVSGAKVSATVFGGTLVSAIWIEFLGAVLAIVVGLFALAVLAAIVVGQH